MNESQAITVGILDVMRTQGLLSERSVTCSSFVAYAISTRWTNGPDWIRAMWLERPQRAKHYHLWLRLSVIYAILRCQMVPVILYSVRFLTALWWDGLSERGVIVDAKLEPSEEDCTPERKRSGLGLELWTLTATKMVPVHQSQVVSIHSKDFDRWWEAMEKAPRIEREGVVAGQVKKLVF